MAFAIVTIVIMLCVIVALSINLVRERKAHMIEIDRLEADVMNANMNAAARRSDVCKLEEQLAQARHSLRAFGCRSCSTKPLDGRPWPVKWDR